MSIIKRNNIDTKYMTNLDYMIRKIVGFENALNDNMINIINKIDKLEKYIKYEQER